jgi:hypothetical protein
MWVLGTNNDGVAFANVDADEASSLSTLTSTDSRQQARARRDISHITCHKCGITEHYASNCPELEQNKQESGVQMLMAGVEDGAFNEATSFQFLLTNEDQGISLHQQRNGRVPTSWILLDNQSTVNVFSNKELLTNIRTTDRVMNIRCNAGVTRTSMIGDLPGYDGEVWYNPKGIANILSLSDVEKYHQVTYDSRAEKAFVVHKADGNERCFKQSEKGLFYLGTNEKLGTVLINTVAGNKGSYTKRTYKQAMLARKVQNMIGRPSLSSFLKIVENNLLKNCPISREDVLAAEDTWVH